MTTGNGSSASSFDYGNSVLKLSADLSPLSYFAPENWLDLNQSDADLGSVGPALLSNGMIFQLGKEGIGYLLRSANLGGIGGAAFASRVCASISNAAFGGSAYSTPYVYAPCVEGIVALQIAPPFQYSACCGAAHPSRPGRPYYQADWSGPSTAAAPCTHSTPHQATRSFRRTWARR